MEASLGAGSNSKAIKIYIRPAVSGYTGTISTLQFTVGIPSATSPVPTLALVTDNLSCNWLIGPSYTEGGYRLWDLTTTVSPSVNIPVGVETQVMELTFSSTGNSTTNVSLVTLPGGGTVTVNTLFYSTATAGTSGNSKEGQLYYTRPGTTVTNNMSYTGALASNATISGVVLPIAYTNFTAIKKDQNALVSWTVQNQDANSDYFNIERSLNGTDFTTIGRAEVNQGAGSSVSYQYTDLNITTLKSQGIIYYRLKSTDKNGSFVYSAIKDVRFNDKVLGAKLYPNPATAFTSVIMDLPEACPVVINVTDASGKNLRIIEMNGLKGINQKRIDLSSYSSGIYLFTIRASGQEQTLSLVK